MENTKQENFTDQSKEKGKIYNRPADYIATSKWDHIVFHYERKETIAFYSSYHKNSRESLLFSKPGKTEELCWHS